MHKSDAMRVDVVKHEDKEQRLRQFVLAGLGACRLEGRTIDVVARSLESPVIRALCALQAGGELGGIGIRIVVVESSLSFGPLPVSKPPTVALENCVARQIKDRRVLDAHEQMVLSSSIFWVGDCMRRDPSRRDAFETTSMFGVRAAAFAAASFEKLWLRATPMLLTQAVATSAPAELQAVAVDGGAMQIQPAADADAVVAVSTRN